MTLKLKPFYTSIYSVSETAVIGRRISNAIAELFADDPVGTALKSKVKENTDLLVSALEHDKKHDYTPLLHQIDEKRDDCLWFIKYVAKANTKHYSNNEKRMAAQEIYDLHNEHINNVSQMGYAEKSNKINFLVKTFESPNFKKFSKVLHLTDAVGTLKQTEDEFEELLNEKVSGENSQQAPAYVAVDKLIASLKELFGYINALLATGTGSMENTADTINEIIESVETIARARRTRKENSNGVDEEPVPPIEQEEPQTTQDNIQ